jgi:hypothetical protein
MIRLSWSSLEGAVIVSLGKWMLAVGFVAAATGTASAGDVGFSIGVGGPHSSFGFSYNQPGWGGGHYHRGWGSNYSVGLYAAPRYYPAPRYIYPSAVVVPAPTYIVQPAPVVYQAAPPVQYQATPPVQYQATPPVQYQTTAPAQYETSPPIQVPAAPGRVPPPPPRPPSYSPNGY